MYQSEQSSQSFSQPPSASRLYEASTQNDQPSDKIPVQAISVARVFCFVTILVGIFALGTLYEEQLWHSSKEVILSLAATTSESQIAFYQLLSELTGGNVYLVAVMTLSPFLSRERFWFYILAFQFAIFVKVNIKLIKSEPRPVFMWAEIPEYGCSTSFGSPSGHSTMAANFVFLLLLDLFFPSQWSRTNYPQLNKMSVSSHPGRFGLCLVFLMTYLPLILFDRIVLGKHTLNQVLLGSQTGIWCALFCHFVLRDFIFSHVSNITHGISLDKAKATSYGYKAILLTVVAQQTVWLVASVSKGSHEMKQQWLINLRDVCGEVYDTDAQGNLVGNSNGMYTGSIVTFAAVFGILGLFIGQLIFRVKGYGRLASDSYTKKSGLVHQLVFTTMLYLLQKVPDLVKELKGEDISPLFEACFFIIVPHLTLGLVQSLVLPALGNKMSDYPEVTPELKSLLPIWTHQKSFFKLQEPLLKRSSSMNSEMTIQSQHSFALSKLKVGQVDMV